ncbi:MAG: TatD family hydrolase [Gammaproteobacteria bacterium]|nr:TatD family hydrolase [Gammaproteobacteria bacterium]
MIDIGANLTDKSFRDDIGDVVGRAVKEGIEYIVVTGTNESASHLAATIASQFPNRLAFTAGVHPHHADDVADDWLDTIVELTRRGAVAIGETGLDYFRNFSTRTNQRSVFQAQLELAATLELPVFVHDRDSNGEVLDMLQQYAATDVVVHCFTGDGDLLDAYLDIGCSIGITGWICDPRRGMELAKIVNRIPDDRLMLETDSPYLMPKNISPKPKTRRNEPMNLAYVRQKVADARNQSESHIDVVTTNNAKRFFQLEEITQITNE